LRHLTNAIPAHLKAQTFFMQVPVTAKGGRQLFKGIRKVFIRWAIAKAEKKLSRLQVKLAVLKSKLTAFV
jgi:hypothetical protein